MQESYSQDTALQETGSRSQGCKCLLHAYSFLLPKNGGLTPQVHGQFYISSKEPVRGWLLQHKRHSCHQLRVYSAAAQTFPTH